MSIVSNSQSFSAGASGIIDAGLKSLFKFNMDAVLFDLGRDITVHLEPAKSPCPSSDCRFNPFYKKFVGQNGAICEECRGQGFIYEQRQTVYRANIRWTDEPFADKDWQQSNVAGRIPGNFVRTKTVQSSHDHIVSSVGATIDGIDVELFEEPRYVAFGSILYTVAFWKKVGR